VPIEERMKLALQAWQRAQNDFQYMFDNHRLSRTGEPYPDPTHYFARVVDFLNAPKTLGFIREITGLPDIAWADAQATLYRPGDFLNVHDDSVSKHRRLVAYVLNMTPAWRPDWGGALNFLGASGHVEEAYVPTFNALNVFRVPAKHFVGNVAPYEGVFGDRMVSRPLSLYAQPICAEPLDPIGPPARTRGGRAGCPKGA
jgi:Rps23 Pro-64 3,4-dihydroxylase Tpa1-like proline 4-hydroxylase